MHILNILNCCTLFKTQKRLLIFQPSVNYRCPHVKVDGIVDSSVWHNLNKGKFETKSPDSLRWSGVLKRVGMETEPMLKKYKTPHKLIFRCGCSVCYPANPYRTIIKHVRKHLDNDETYQNKSSLFPQRFVSQRFVCQSICIN